MNVMPQIYDLINKIPVNFQPAVVTGAATIIGAFLGTTFSQFISHLLAEKRENHKYYKKIYQNLFAPVLLDVYAYLDICTHFKRGFDIKYNIDEEEILKKIIKHIENNLMFAGPDITFYFNKVKRSEYQEDFSGYLYRVNELDLFEAFLLELYDCNKRLKLLSRESKHELIKYVCFYRLLSMGTEYYGEFMKAEGLFKYKTYFDYRKLTYFGYKRIALYEKWAELDMKFCSWFTNKKKNSNKVFKFLFNSKLHDRLYKRMYVVKKIAFNKVINYVTMSSNKELLKKRIKFEEDRIVFFEKKSRFAGEVFFIDIVQNSSQTQVEFKLKVRNISEVPHEINISNFKLIKFGVRRIDHTAQKSYFTQSYNKIMYKLMPTEVCELVIHFTIDMKKVGGYFLNYIPQEKMYALEKVNG